MRVKPSSVLSLSFVFATGAVALSLWATLHIYRAAPVTSDENSYEFQARCFAEGHLRRPWPELSRALKHFNIIMNEDHGWLSRYPPGHALWLTPGVWMGEPRIMVFLAAGLAVLLLCMAARQAGMPVWTVGIPLVASPYFINIYGTVLSHTSGFLYGAALLAAWLAWKKTSRPLFAALAGLSWAAMFLNRTYTATLIALPLGLDALYLGIRHFKNRRLLGGVVLFACTAALGIAAYALYNALAIGDPLTPTFLFYEPSEGLGFGLRHTQRLAVRHTERKGLLYLWNNIVALDVWLWGFRGSLVAAIALIAIGWKRHISIVLLGTTVSVWIGYVFFWFWGIQDVGGPVYYFETLPFIIFLSASGLARAHARLGERIRLGCRIIPALIVLLPIGGIRLLRQEIPRLREPQTRRRIVMDTLNSAPANSLIFVSHVQFPRPEEIVFNPKGMESDPLLLHGTGDANPWLRHFAPDRTPFLFDGRTPEKLMPLPFADIPDRIEWKAADMHRRIGANVADKDGGRIRIAPAGSDEGYLAFGRHIPLAVGRYRAYFHLGSDEYDSAARIDVATRDGHDILAKRIVHLPVGSRESYELIFETDRFLWAEPRVYFPGQGEVRVGNIGIILDEK